jgi:hypothetical protein
MIWLTLIGMLFNLFGVIFLAVGFRTEKTKSEKEGEEFHIEGKLPIVLRYENPALRILGWYFLVIGYILQAISLFI